jgi:hypothetical protein
VNKHDIWLRSLKVGDIICDCRCKHVRIKSIYDTYFAKTIPIIVDIFLYFDKYEWYDKICQKLGFIRWVDRDFELEDGYYCSGSSCASDPSTHEEGKWEEYERRIPE